HTVTGEAGLFVGAYRPRIVRIRVSDNPRRTVGQDPFDERPDKGRSMTAIDHVRLANELIDATGAAGVFAQSVVWPHFGIVALDISRRPVVDRDDELIHGFYPEIAADQLKLLIGVAPPLDDVRF